MTERTAIELTGRVQGVGFRPFVYSLATSLDLRGFVQNRGADVLVDVEGDASALTTFFERLIHHHPANAAIDDVRRRPLPRGRHRRFEIARSEPSPDVRGAVPSDIATCAACLSELFDPSDRRYHYPFIACAGCGPRYSMITKLPFDRADTAMAAFSLCAACSSEYHDPRNRRFHAQAICCAACGPRLWISDRNDTIARDGEALDFAVMRLREGAIVALKGIGGFHLACDAADDAAIVTLRRRKKRHSKPLALMLPMPAGNRLVNRLEDRARAHALSPERPIVLVDRGTIEAMDEWPMSREIAPDSAALGIFLPYSPIHHLLLTGVGRPLVMTSGNRRDEPMACDNALALEQLDGIADLFLLHDRQILRRCDDSVVRVFAGRDTTIRNGRGSAPLALTLAERAPQPVLGVGGDLKNSFCLAHGTRAHLSAHVGSIDSLSGCDALSAAIAQLSQLLNVEPAVVVHDRHPDFLSTRVTEEFPRARRVAVQHHHAHVLSCVAEHRCAEPVIGVAFDGAGLGDDGAMWGGEFLIVEGIQSHRAAHLAYVPLPGGDAAAREPWRMAASYLAHAYGPDLGGFGEPLARRVTSARLDVVRQMVTRGICSPPTSSVGRLFDAVAALVGLRDTADFEGQAAMALEAAATSSGACRYEFVVEHARDPWTLSPDPVIRAIACDVARGVPTGNIAAAFHVALAEAIGRIAGELRRKTGIGCVALTGGVFQNARLSFEAARVLQSAGFTVFAHRRVPCNDGGLSLGQALYGLRALRANV